MATHPAPPEADAPLAELLLPAAPPRRAGTGRGARHLALFLLAAATLAAVGQALPR